MTNAQVENLYTPRCLRTFTGIYINVFEPTSEMINIVDIAHSLSNQCRFAGHLPEFYSVAEHSIHCASMVDEQNKLGALLHDASEAYLIDIPRPVKRELCNYENIEDNLMYLIAQKFGFQYPLHKNVKLVDEVMLQYEWDALMLQRSVKQYAPMTKDEAKTKFLEMFNILKK